MTESSTPEPTPAVEQDDERQLAGADDVTQEAPRDDDSEGTDEAVTDDDDTGQDVDGDDDDEGAPATV